MKNFKGHMKAQQAQTKVVEYLKDNGFEISEVKNVTTNGIDIVAIKEGQHLLIEVKSVIYSARSYRVKKIHPQCDYVAVVMPKGQIHFESAYDWVRLSDKNGARSITSLVNLYNLLT